MPSASRWFPLILLSALVVGCDNPNPAGMPSEPPKEPDQSYKDKMKGMNAPPTQVPRGAVQPPAKKE